MLADAAPQKASGVKINLDNLTYITSLDRHNVMYIKLISIRIFKKFPAMVDWGMMWEKLIFDSLHLCILFKIFFLF